jgi:outer membrane protein insertion porin family
MSIKKLLLSLAFISSVANAQIIEKINISGLSVIDRGTVLSYLPLEAGDFYSSSRKQELTNAILKTGFFKNVIITDFDNNLNIEVLENPTIKDVVIEMESDELIELKKIKENLEKLDISKSKIYNKNSLNAFVSQVKKVYSAGGYAEATVEYDVVVDTNNLAVITINIDENEVVKIKSMSIVGANNFSQDELLSLFNIGKADNFIVNFFTKRDNFSQIELDAGLEKLANFYLNHGYLSIAVERVSKTIVAGGLSVEIHISEGAINYIGNITFTNNSELTNAELTKLLALSSGNVFKRFKVIAGVQNITDELADDGYAFAKVTSKTTNRVENGKNLVDMEVSIANNQKVYINRITIDGNTRTSDGVVRREIGVLEGGLYSDTQIDKSLNRLKRLGFFSDVSMKVSNVRGANDRINLHFSVEETKTGQFSIGASHSNSTGIAFNTGIKEKNIFGTGNELNASVAYSKAVQDIDLFFLNPYFTNEGHSLSYGIFSKKIDGSELESSSYITEKTGLSVGYGFPIDEDSRFNFGLKFSNVDITCGGSFAGVDYEQQQCADDYDSEFYGKIGYTKNTLNNAVFPTKGKRLSVTTGVALPLADYRYYKVDVNYKKYIPLKNNLTLSFNGVVGFADGYSDRELPFFERYYGGGASSVRGFSFNSLGEKYPDGTSKGGKSSILGSVSIISPLGWVKDSSAMRIAAFIDAGGIDGLSSGMEYRASIGIGFVWVTPIGPLGLYAAKPLNKKDGDDTKTVDFTIGTNF